MRVCIFLENWMHFATLQVPLFFSINYLLMANWWKFMSKKQIYQKKSLSLQGDVSSRDASCYVAIKKVDTRR